MSVMIALERLGVSYLLTDDHEALKSADKIIFPGVGQAKTAMESLRKKGLDQLIPELKQPFLGTCVGMQLLCRHSEEGDVKGIGVFDIDILKFESETLKIPQTGWNTIFDLNSSKLKGIKENDYFYFNHSYYAPLSDFTVAKTNYEFDYSSILEKENFLACQFHTEISGNVGEVLLRNFLAD